MATYFWIAFSGITALGALVIFLWYRGKETRNSFLISNWNVDLLRGAFSSSAAWTHPLAAIVSAQFAYMGVAHFLAFAVPNIAVMILMAYFAPRIRRVKPEGFTMPEFIGEVFGPRTRTLYFVGAVAALVYLMVLSLTVLMQWLNQYLAIPAWQITVAVGFAAALWASLRGLRGAILSDFGKMSILLAGVVAIVIFVVADGSAWRGLSQGLAKLSPEGATPGEVFWTFGVPVAISLLAAGVTNPDIVERVYAIRREVVSRSFLWGALIFAAVVLSSGTLGFIASGIGEITVNVNKEQVLLVFLEHLLPAPAVATVYVLVTVVLIATVTTVLVSVGDISAIEGYRRFVKENAPDKTVLRFTRSVMIAFIAVAVFVAAFNIPLHVLLQNMAVVRAPQYAPVLLALFLPWGHLSESVFWGMVVGFLAGAFVIFWWGDKPVGALVGVLVPLMFFTAGALLRRKSFA